MKLDDVRRLTGTSLFLDGRGAAAEIEAPPGEASLAVAIWRRRMRALLEAVGWGHERVVARGHANGASIAISAPIDCLEVACDMIEQVWRETQAVVEGEAPSDTDEVIAAFTKKIADTENPNLRSLAERASDRGVSVLEHGNDYVVGLGRHAQRWPAAAIPSCDSVDWNAVSDIPVAMVTGTNGKSTTVRLAAAIGAAAGKTVGLCSSDWVRVGNEILDEGDYSGPGGASLAVQDGRVDMATLEVARGGLMRRGLAVQRADACVITNVTPDHIGGYGITDVEALADAKFVLAKAVKPDGTLILNADSPMVVQRGAAFGGSILWYGLSLNRPWADAYAKAGGTSVHVEDGQMILTRPSGRTSVLAIDDFEPAMRGAAAYNVSNALAAIGIAAALRLPDSAMTKGLAEFRNTPEQNPGRGNLLEVGGVHVMIDFAHNPDGMEGLLKGIAHLPAKRRLITLGQGGDRRDEDIRAFARVTWEARPDHIVIKELPKKLRGRKLGAVSDLIEDELRTLGAPESAFSRAESEMASVRKALAWANAGDFIILPLYEQRKAAMDLLQRLVDDGWQAGDPVSN